jgi:hypothetical protein
VPALDLLPPISRYLEENEVLSDSLFLDDNHPSVEGSRVVASILAPFVVELMR